MTRLPIHGLEVEEIETIEAAPAPRDYPDPLADITSNVGTEHDADALAPARGICAAIGVSAVLVALALIVVALVAW